MTTRKKDTQKEKKQAPITGPGKDQTTGEHVPLDLSEVCRQGLTLLQAAAPKCLCFKADLPSPGPVVRANANEIRQILTNLVTNSWEAIGDKQGVVNLSIRTVTQKDIAAAHRFPVDWQPRDLSYACLEVSDSGCGIAKEDINKLFDPFFSTKFVGRGLCLPVVLGIIKAHNGVVTVQSEAGTGTALRIYLPVSAEEIPRLTMTTGQIPTHQEGYTVLVVDDEEMLREIAEAMLTSLGYKVLPAKDGIEAVEVFKKLPGEIHAVLCDLSMPRMNGWETLSALRLIQPDIPIILASGHDESAVLAGDHPERPQVFLHKPYGLLELNNAIHRALGPPPGDPL